jgi:cytochrome c oxidase cbb3-type subunit III
VPKSTSNLLHIPRRCLEINLRAAFFLENACPLRIACTGTSQQAVRPLSVTDNDPRIPQIFFKPVRLRSTMAWSLLLWTSLAIAGAQVAKAGGQASGASGQKPPEHLAYPAAAVKSGGELFQQNCAFCHGKDAGGGETGPDLTRSKLVAQDVDGDKIGLVVRQGRPDKGMPHFDFAAHQIDELAAFIHNQQTKALEQTGGRRGVDISDLKTGSAAAGKQYFNGGGGCAACHSPTGDLAGIASRHQGLELEKRMLYPENAKSKVAVTLASGQKVTGTLAYLDEFTVGLIDPEGFYQSWRTGDVKFRVDAPADAHVELFDKYTDEDIHNLMAYLQTLR